MKTMTSCTAAGSARIWQALALCALTATLVAGCTDEPEEPLTTPNGADTPSAEEIQAASEAAETALRAYFQVKAQCLTDPPNTEPSCFDQVANDQVLADDYDLLETAQERGFHYVGQVAVEWVEIGDVDLESIAQIQVTACVDWTRYQALSPDGTPFVPRDEGASTRGQFVYKIRNYAYPSATRWRVGQDLTPEGDVTPC